jgi:hypothetical protein
MENDEEHEEDEGKPEIEADDEEDKPNGKKIEEQEVTNEELNKLQDQAHLDAEYFRHHNGGIRCFQ